jgi:hypothetical protein
LIQLQVKKEVRDINNVDDKHKRYIVLHAMPPICFNNFNLNKYLYGTHFGIIPTLPVVG